MLYCHEKIENCPGACYVMMHWIYDMQLLQSEPLYSITITLSQIICNVYLT